MTDRTERRRPAGTRRPASANLPAARDDAADPPGEGAPALPAAEDPYFDALVASACDAGRDVRRGRATRIDGWQPRRIAIFLYALAQTGTAAAAARAAGMSLQSAFALRNSAKGRAFALAWDAALLRARPSIVETLVSRALHGWDEPVFYEGKVCGHRRRYDNRVLLAVLTRLDRQAAAIDRRGAASRIVAEEFEPFVGLVVRREERAADFVGERLWLARRGVDEPELLGRADNYDRCGGALASEIDVSDLDPADRAGWSAEQAERARRSGLLDAIDGGQEADDAAPALSNRDRSDPA